MVFLVDLISNYKNIRILRNFFNKKFYILRYEDVRSSNFDPFKHYLKFGREEGRLPRGDFHPDYYRRTNGNSALDPFLHWATIGQSAGLRGHPWIDDPNIDDVAEMRNFFDHEFYVRHNPDVAEAGVDPFNHFIASGWKEGRNPNSWFNIADYVAMNEDLNGIGINPFSHYVIVGKNKGLASTYIEYAREIGIDQFQYNLIKENFDFEFYRNQLNYLDMIPSDLVNHYILNGAKEGLDPTRWFSTDTYLTKNPDVMQSGVNGFFHFLCQGRSEGRSGGVGHPNVDPAPIGVTTGQAGGVFSEHLQFSGNGPSFEELDTRIARSRKPRAKLIAYYLPQFHAIPENDEWWGRGFTEWRNIVRGQPRFRGHQQPRVPETLGFYDLSDISVMKRQVEIAKSAAIHGFCFYYYNFNGRRILERPIEAFLGEKSIEFPFALMWANENWTRTWDGLDRSVLLKQDYNPEDDYNFVADVARHFRDARYIRIDGRPLFFIYRPGQIPESKARIAAWRQIWEDRFGERPLIFMAQGFDDIDPRVYDLDGAIEFPPHKICSNMRPLNDDLEILDPEFSGHVVSYEEVIERSLGEATPAFPLIKTAVPSWDNEARRPGRGMTLHGSTPESYEMWLRRLTQHSITNPVYGEAIVAVNAWNEWAEGAYLEPDVFYGSAYLNATARALVGAPMRGALVRRKIVLVGHDAYRHGAQLLVLNMAAVLKRQFGFEVHIVVCGEGPLLEDYRRIADSVDVVGREDAQAAARVAQLFASQGCLQALVNTTVSGWMVPHLKRYGYRVTCLIHELPQIIREYGLETMARQIAEGADSVIFAAELVRNSFVEISGPILGQTLVRAQGLYREDIIVVSAERRKQARKKLSIPHNAKLVINVGYADMRKGFDIFLATARRMCAQRDDIYFVWVGGGTPDAVRWLMGDIDAQNMSKRIQLTGFTDDVLTYYNAADVFYITSREDPFPSVVLEALAAGLPLVGVRGTCGTNALIQDRGSLVEISDEAGQLTAIERAFSQRRGACEAGPRLVREQFRFDDYCFSLAATVHENIPRISVIVPNYNYARYLEQRLVSIFSQTLPIYELIVLDDASSDDSVRVLEQVAADNDRRIEVIENKKNSGSVFSQWRAGAERAKGEFVWIAEADDDCDPEFLRIIVERMMAEQANIGFSDSWQIDTDGNRQGSSYKSYLSEETDGGFARSFFANGHDFIERYLSVKNVILNVSSVVFRREALQAALGKVGDELLDYKVAGDWRLYLELCSEQDAIVTYEAQPLNGHRRHAVSATHSLNAARHFGEILRVQERAETLVGSLPVEVEDVRSAYRKKVRNYLGLDDSSEDSAPDIKSNVVQ